MTTKTQEIYRLVLELEPDERAELLEQLNASAQEDEELATVVKRRMDEVAAGTAKLIPWSDVRARMEGRAASDS